MLSIIFAASCKKKTRNSTVEELLQEIDCLTESYKSVIKSSAPRKQYAKHVFRYGSTDNKTGKRNVHCPRKFGMSAKKKNDNLSNGEILSKSRRNAIILFI